MQILVASTLPKGRPEHSRMHSAASCGVTKLTKTYPMLPFFEVRIGRWHALYRPRKPNLSNSRLMVPTSMVTGMRVSMTVVLCSADVSAASSLAAAACLLLAALAWSLAAPASGAPPTVEGAHRGWGTRSAGGARCGADCASARRRGPLLPPAAAGRPDLASGGGVGSLGLSAEDRREPPRGVEAALAAHKDAA